MKNILTEALVDSATNVSFIFGYTNSAKSRICLFQLKKWTNRKNTTEVNQKSNYKKIRLFL